MLHFQCMKYASPPLIRKQLRVWYRRTGRDLPWRRSRDPYAIAVSEVMLQQTQVDRVIPKYQAWLKAFPTPQALAVASLHDVLSLWAGLGYNRRARMLRDAARVVVAEHGGVWPSASEVLRTLPGFGPYTAAAVAVFSGRERIPMIDTNIRRVLLRWTKHTNATPAELIALAQNYQPSTHVDEWYHAMMDLGALVCRSRPLCLVCPLAEYCPSAGNVIAAPKKRRPVRFHDTRRFVRGRVVAWFVEHQRGTLPQLVADIRSQYRIEQIRIEEAVGALLEEKMIRRSGRALRIAS